MPAATDITPDQMAKVEHYARLWKDDELQGCCDIHPESPVGKVLAALPALVASVRKLDRIREILAVDNDGPEGPMTPRWILGQIQEVLNGGT